MVLGSNSYLAWFIVQVYLLVKRKPQLTKEQTGNVQAGNGSTLTIPRPVADYSFGFNCVHGSGVNELMAVLGYGTAKRVTRIKRVD